MSEFELSMPNKGSWNGKWSQEGQLFVRTRRERDVPKEYWNKSFFYRWDDGWTACVTTTRMPANEARKLERKSKWEYHSNPNFGINVEDAYCF